MKNEPTPHHETGAPIHPRHQFEHVTPTVIHDPEADMTLLGRWVSRAMQNPSLFWGWIVGGVGALLGLVILLNVFSSKGGGASEVWNELDAARNADARLEVARKAPNSPAAPWAKFQAGAELYHSGISDLPSNSEAALQTLKKAYDLFDELGKELAKDSPLAAAAAFGKARALEARNELPKAVDQYNFVSETWPDAPEAMAAKKQAEALKQPAAVAFYKDLYAYKPVKVSLPPLGTEKLDFPAVIPPPPADGSTTPDSALIPPPPTSASPAAAAAAPEEAPKVEAAAPAEAPKAEPAAPAEAPKAEPAAPAEAPKAEPAKP